MKLVEPFSAIFLTVYCLSSYKSTVMGAIIQVERVNASSAKNMRKKSSTY